jgi:hypothetical protein
MPGIMFRGLSIGKIKRGGGRNKNRIKTRIKVEIKQELYYT